MIIEYIPIGFVRILLSYYTRFSATLRTIMLRFSKAKNASEGPSLLRHLYAFFPDISSFPPPSSASIFIISHKISTPNVPARNGKLLLAVFPPSA
jgi:hypothetical protein